MNATTIFTGIGSAISGLLDALKPGLGKYAVVVELIIIAGIIIAIF